MLDLAIVGAGPIGLEAAILAQRARLRYRVFDKGALVDAIYRYPTYMTFFTTSERLEIGGHPLVTATEKATRKEALDYYRKVAHAEALEVASYHQVTDLTPDAGGFRLTVCAGGDDEHTVRARAVALATGYFDNPNRLGVPGEDGPHVSHYYREAHPHYGRDVVNVGAGSSAADAALDLWRTGARVTMLHRGNEFRHSLKYWIRPNLLNRVAEGSIRAYFRTVLRSIETGTVVAEKDGRQLRLPADQVLLLTGYHASDELLRKAGAAVDPETLAAVLDEHFQTTVPGLYCIGSAGFGRRTSDVFIENGLAHAEVATRHLVARLAQTPGA